jgi:hypothetical protein
MSRYDKLKQFLKNAKGTDVDMSFAQIEAVLGRALPPSALKHRAWWSNNPDNNVMTQAWLAAGYQSCDVDMVAKSVTFECVGAPHAKRRSLPFSGVQQTSSVAERAQSGFVYDGSFLASGSLSPRAQDWLDKMSENDRERDRLVIDVIESLAAKARRKSIVEKYSKLGIGSGSDSVDLIRESRDER